MTGQPRNRFRFPTGARNVSILASLRIVLWSAQIGCCSSFGASTPALYLKRADRLCSSHIIFWSVQTDCYSHIILFNGYRTLFMLARRGRYVKWTNHAYLVSRSVTKKNCNSINQYSFFMTYTETILFSFLIISIINIFPQRTLWILTSGW